MYSLLGTNSISLPKGTFEDDVTFSLLVGYVTSPAVEFFPYTYTTCKHPRLVRRASLLGKLGRLEEIEVVQRKISLLFSDPEDFREELETGTGMIGEKKG